MAKVDTADDGTMLAATSTQSDKRFSFSVEALDTGLTLENLDEFESAVDRFKFQAHLVQAGVANTEDVIRTYKSWLRVGEELLKLSAQLTQKSERLRVVDALRFAPPVPKTGIAARILARLFRRNPTTPKGASK